MKFIIYIVLSLIALSLANPNETSSHNAKHIFLVKTELTKEQIEKLLYEHHLNQTQLLEKTNLRQNENDTQGNHNSQEHQPETREFKKKQKKEKNQNKNKEQKMEQEMAKEIPQIQDEQTTSQPPVQEEIEHVEQEVEKELNETTNLKDKKHKKEKTHSNEVKELNETEVKEAMNETEALIEVGNPNNNCPEQKTTLIEKTENTQNNLSQSNSPIFNFFCVVFLAIAFISFFIYATQPKKKVSNNYYMNQRIKVKV